MKPPKNRRSGHSRKAQVSAFTGYIVAAAGAAIGAALLVFSLWNPGNMGAVRSEATDIVAPVGEAGGTVRSSGISFIDAIAGYFRAGSQNSLLRREAQEARVRLVEAEAIKAENKHLKQLLALGNTEVKPVAYARLIGSTSSSTRRFAYLSAGRSQGVKPGMPVLSPMGLVGRVLEAGDSSARVLLLTDGASMVPVRRAQDDVVAFAEGRADGSLRLRLINLGINPIKKGDVFVTSGAGGIYRPGIAVAQVETVTRDGAIARPLGNPAVAVYVAIEPAWAPEAEAVAEPLPETGTGE
jgi:rod shape-determining protein MreC